MVKKKPTKETCQREYSRPEIYDSYYSLILNIEPFAETFLSYKLDKIPAIVQAIYKKKVEEFKSKYPDEEDGLPGMDAYLDDYLQWHIEKGIPLLHTKDSQSITSLADIKRLWQNVGLSGGTNEHNNKLKMADGYEDYMNKLTAYLYKDHEKNLKELETLAQPGQGEKKKVAKPSLTTLEILYILGAIAGIAPFLCAVFPEHKPYIVVGAIVFTIGIVPLLLLRVSLRIILPSATIAAVLAIYLYLFYPRLGLDSFLKVVAPLLEWPYLLQILCSIIGSIAAAIILGVLWWLFGKVLGYLHRLKD